MERFVDLIHDKKNGKELSDESIRDMIEGFTKGYIPDYQMSAMLMAICYEGLNDRELTTMTLAMRDSGTINDLSAIGGIKVDKHSTGGVGDKTTLIIGPIAASSGIPIAKMRGRGLGFTGGTIDKLESIPGFHTDLSTAAFFEAVKKTGICVNGQTADLAPADKKIYSFCYGAGYDRTLSFDFTVVMRAVKTTLTGCSGSNAATAVEDGAAYTTTLTPKNGYTFDTVTVSMGGTDITATAYNAATGVVSIARVTGNITITATASKPVTYTNLVPTAVDSSGASMPYQNGYNLSSSGNAQSDSGFVTSGFIPLPGNVTKHVYRIAGEGIVFSKAEAYCRVGWYDSTFQLLKTVIPANKIDVSVYFPSSIPESTTAMTFQVTEAASNVPASAAYFRVSAMGKGENLIITLDEPIE